MPRRPPSPEPHGGDYNRWTEPCALLRDRCRLTSAPPVFRPYGPGAKTTFEERAVGRRAISLASTAGAGCDGQPGRTDRRLGKRN